MNAFDGAVKKEMYRSNYMNTLTNAVKGTHCAYALKLEGDAESPEYIYCGSTADIQTRMAQHAGGIPGGAKFTTLHKPVCILNVIPCETAFQAACVEVGLWGMYAGLLKDYDKVRGGKFCMCEKLQYAPTGWKTHGAPVEREECPIIG